MTTINLKDFYPWYTHDEYIEVSEEVADELRASRLYEAAYFCDSKTCAACSRREECFGKSMKRKMVDRHVWQDALDRVMYFTKTPRGARIYAWRKETIERSFAEAKENHGLRFARMLGIQNMREQCFLTAAVQNMKRLAKVFCFSFRIHCMLKGRVAESNFCGTPLLQTNQEKNGGIASKSNQPKPKKV